MSEMKIVSSNMVHEAGASVRRTVVAENDQTGVVFTADFNTSGRSLTNVFERLAWETSKELGIPADEIHWFERKLSERTKDGLPQTPCFDEVTFSEHNPPSNPQWSPLAENSFGERVAAVLQAPEKREID